MSTIDDIDPVELENHELKPLSELASTDLLSMGVENSDTNDANTQRGLLKLSGAAGHNAYVLWNRAVLDAGLSMDSLRKAIEVQAGLRNYRHEAELRLLAADLLQPPQSHQMLALAMRALTEANCADDAAALAPRLNDTPLSAQMLRAVIRTFQGANKPRELAQWIEHNRVNIDVTDPEKIPIACRAAATARNRPDLPPVLIPAMPKSASSTFSELLSVSYGYLRTYIAAIKFIQEPFYAIPSAVRHFAAGGYITKQHLHATDDLVERLHAAGVRKALLQIRNPHDVLISWTKHLQWQYFKKRPRLNPESVGFLSLPFSAKVMYFAEEIFEPICQIPLSWRRQQMIETKAVTFEQIMGDPEKTVRSCAAFIGLPDKRPAQLDQVSKKKRRSGGTSSEEIRARNLLIERYPVPQELLELLASAAD